MKNPNVSMAAFLLFSAFPQSMTPQESASPSSQAQANTETVDFLKEGGKYFSVSMGFMDSPDSFLLGLGYSEFVEDRFAIGPLLQLGLDDDFSLFAPTLDLKWYLETSEPNLFPYLHAGAGFAFMEKENRPGDDDEMGFLVNFGVGANYRISDKVYLGSDILFNVFPDEVLGEHFFFSWQVIGISFRF